MPLIPNYIARLRTHSQSTAATSSSHSGSRSNSTAGPPTPGPEFGRLAIEPPSAGQITTISEPTPREQVARKIHPDISALLDENAAADSAVEVLGPRPPRGRSRSVGQLASTQPEVVSPKGIGDQDIQQAGAEPPTDDVQRVDVPASPRSPFLSRILSAPLLGGSRSTPTTPTTNADTEPDPSGLGTHWSTFGRRRLLASPISEFGSLHRRGSGSKSSAQSKASRRRAQRGSTPATPSTTRAPSRIQTAASTANTPPSQTNSPVGTVSSSSGSKSYSQHSQSVRSRRHPQTYPEPIPDVEPPSDLRTPLHTPLQHSSVSPFTPLPGIISPMPTRPHLDGSPHTFGRVTPKRPGVSLNPQPEVGGAFLPPLTSTPPPPEHHTRRINREPPSTYPPRSRKRSSGGGSTISFPSLPLKPFARSQSKPRAEDVFRDRDHDRSPILLGARFGLGSFLSGEVEDAAGRRTSADWSAAEAVRDVDPGGGESWPATVSREMVRLSLGGRRGRGGSAIPVSAGMGERDIIAEVGEVGTMTEAGAKNPTLFGSTGEDRRRFFRVGRRKPASIPVSASSGPPQQSQPLQPAFSVSPPPEPSGSSSRLSTDVGKGTRGEGLVPKVSVTGPTPSVSPSGSHMNTLSDPGPSGYNGNSDHTGTAKSRGKRKKAESEDEAPPTELGVRSILLSRRESSNRPSDVSHAPSSFRHSKRIRLSTPSHSPPHEHLSRSHSSPHHSPPGSPGSRPSSSLRTFPPVNPRTLSQSSIPLRAIVSPRPPSIDRRSTYHMRDPALPPPRRQSTQWTGGARKGEEVGKRTFPLQGWAFVVGFLVFPLWWVAAAAPVGWGWGRNGIGVQDGKGMWTEEELAAREVMEYDVAYTWRQRCRLMSLLGLLVYVPLIALLAVLVPRA